MAKEKNITPQQAAARQRRRRAFESAATFGLLLLAVGLVAPFTDIENLKLIAIFKWIFGAGALIYTVSRFVGGADPDDSLRVRRLHRMEAWAGIAFCIATFFWFYNATRLQYMSLGSMRDTVIFTLVGALIQIIASWMIASVRRKEASASDDHAQNK